MADDLTVSFGADTSNLQDGVNRGKAAITSFGSSMSALKSSVDQLSSAMNDNATASTAATSHWRENLAALADLTIVARGAYDAVSDLTSGFADAARIGQTAGTEIRSGLVEVASAGQEAGLSLRASVNAVTEYVESLAHGSGAARSFIHDQEGIAASAGRAVEAVTTFFNTIRLYQTDLPKDVLGGIFDAGGGASFTKEIERQGLQLKEVITGFIAQIQQIPDTSDEAAGSIQKMLGSIPNYTVDANNALIELIATISANGDAAVSNTQKIVEALKDSGATGGRTVGAMVAKMVDDLKDASLGADGFTKKLQDINQLSVLFANTLQPASASAFQDALLEKLRAQQATQKAIADANAAALAKEGILGQAISYARQRQVDLEKEQNAERQKTIDLLTQEKALTDGITAAQGREQAFRDTLDKANPIDAQIDDVSSKIAILQNKLQQGTGDSPKLTAADIDTLVRTVIGEAGGESAQGQLAVAAVALNRLANGNFGDSLEKLLKAGDGAQFNVWKPGDATGAQSIPTSSYQYQRTLQDIVMPLLQNQAPDPTGGALNFYNPSQTPAQNQFPMSNSRMIGNQKFGTAVGSPDAIAPLDPDELAQAQQALQALEDQLAKLNATKAGGTATDRANLEIAQKAVAEGQDQVAAAQKLVDAKKQEVAAAATGSPAAQATAAKGLADAEISLKEKVAEAAVAASRVEAEAYQKGSYEEVAATNAGLAAKLAIMKQGTAEYNALLAEMIANTKRAAQQEAQDQAAAENTKYANAKRALDEQMSAVMAAASERTITAGQEVAQRTQILDQLSELERDHQRTLEAIYQQMPEAYRKASEALLQIDSQRHQQQLKIEQDYQREVETTYRESFESVGNSISSSLMEIIEGTGNFRKLMQGVARDIANQFISSSVKVAADWAAHQAFMLAQAVATQTGMTGATAAGTAAREALTLQGAAAESAAFATRALAFIETAAAETFAGVTAFLSSTLGPAAVGPAAATEAEVIAAGTGIAGGIYDIGSWSLPADQLALVHRGEMIVPQSATPWAQSLMSAAAASGSREVMSGGNNTGTGAGDTHIHIHALDGANVDSWLRNGGALKIGRAVAKLAPTQPSVRMMPAHT